jgi:ABC-type amino acid transport substrate-binding protein
MDQLKQKFQDLTVLLASALALSACGGGGDAQSATSTSAATATAKVEQSKAATTVATTTQEVPVALADATGTILTTSTTGTIDHTNLFFTALGNGRACSSCHQESQAWSVTPAQIQARFTASKGADPIFQLVDGANSPNATVTTLAQKQAAYSMLLTKGVIRIGLPIPSGAQFELTQVNDPYGFASAAELSLFRRPLPTTNLKFESTVMWDGREVFSSTNTTNCIANANPAECFTSTNFDLLDQANSAVKGHAQLASGITAAQQQAVVAFESGLYTAQASDNAAGSLNAGGATGGPQSLPAVASYFGINDFIAGDYQTKARFNPNVMTMFGAWINNAPPPPAPPAPGTRGAPPPVAVTATAQAQASIARGEQIFNTRPIAITGVNGLNDVLNQPNFRGSCSTCHDTPAAGTQSVPRLMNTGVAAAVLRTPDMPLYTLKNIATGATVQTTDPGRALITGEWSDVSKFKVPNLRGMAARAPYFHNGSQPNLAGVVQFYNHRFQMGLSQQEATDLTNFLQSL